MSGLRDVGRVVASAFGFLLVACGSSDDGGKPTLLGRAARTLLSENAFVSDFEASGDTWIFTDPQTASDPTLVFSYRVGEAPQQIGCIAKPVTVHALASTASKVYAGVFRNNTTTVLQFDR